MAIPIRGWRSQSHMTPPVVWGLLRGFEAAVSSNLYQILTLSLLLPQISWLLF